MILRIDCEDDIFYVEIPTEKAFRECSVIGASEKLKSTLKLYHLKYPIVPIKELEKSTFDFQGLWFTSTKQFVHVISESEAYVLQEDGQRLTHCKVDSKGNTDIAGQLDHSKRGDESRVKLSPQFIWPSPK